MAPTPGPDYQPLVHEVARLGGDVTQAWPQLDERLRPLLGYEASTFSTLDPPTLLWTSRQVIGIESSPARETKVLELEHRGDDLNSFANMLIQQMPIGNLVTATGGNLAKCIRYEHILRELDLVDELRAVVKSEQLSWGALTLYRMRPGEPFTYKDLRAVRDLLEPFGALLRLRMLRSAADDPGSLDRPPGLLQVSAEGTVTDTSPAAAARLETVADPSAIAAAVAEVVTAFHDGDALAHATLPAGEEGSVTLHASVGADGTLAIVVEEDRLVLLAQQVIDGYQLTEDESEVLSFYSTGRTTRNIAQVLAIDAFAVQAMLMSLFAKIGRKNRAEIWGTVYYDHFADRIAAGARPNPYGYFLD